MKQAGGEGKKRRWVWPRFSLLELLIATAVLAALWGFLGLREESDELIDSMVGTLTIVWCLICWKAVRANRHLFELARDDPATDDQRSGRSPSADDAPHNG